MRLSGAGMPPLYGVYSTNHINVSVLADGPDKNLIVNLRDVYLESP